VFKIFKKLTSKIKNALSKTRSIFGAPLRRLLKKPLNPETLEEIEQILFEADLGAECTTLFIETLERFHRKNPGASTDELIEALKAEMGKLFDTTQTPMPELQTPHVILIVGVNGSGKTTTIAKLANKFIQDGKKTHIAAGETFRAAAIEQLGTWAERVGADFIASKQGADPASVAFDACSAAKARGADVVLIDTAGRLQSKTDLMRELEKIRNSAGKVIPSAPHEIYLILDATTGQNGIDQAEVFNNYTPLSALILTKLDGSAKGGIALSIAKRLKLPIRYVGLGEQMDDLELFDPSSYIDALFDES